MTTIARSPQPLEALERANARRAARSAWRQRVNANPAELLDVLADPPAELEGVPLIDLLRWARGSRRSARSLWIVNGKAVRAGVNLMLPLGRASTQTRAWCAEHGLWHARSSRTDA